MLVKEMEGQNMKVVSDFIVKHKKIVAAGVMLLFVVMAICAFQVEINYNMMDYLPENANSTKAISLMSDNFDESMANCKVMMPDMEITEAIQFKEKLKTCDGVSNVEWLDDIVDITVPLETQDADAVESYYKDKNALFSVTIEDGKERDGVNAIYKAAGKDAAVTGNAVSQASSQNLAVSQAMKSIMLIAPLIILVLILSTTSWIEPLVYLNTIGVAVIINWGMQIFWGGMSYVTMAVSPILQLAVSLDYAVFLCNSFEEHRKQGLEPECAMKKAMKKSFKAIAASAATTLFGFIALLFMDFKIGTDMGISLVRGVILSFLAVMIFLPALLLLVYKLVDKTRHKRLIPDFSGCGKVLTKICVPVLIIVFILIVPAYQGQKNNYFMYGSGEPAAESRLGKDTKKMEKVFENSTIAAMLVPVGHSNLEKILCDELEELEHVKNVVSYTKMVGNEIPTAYLSKDITKKFYSDKYARIVIYTDTPSEGEIAFDTVENIKQTAGKYYDEVYLCGESANMYDMKNTVEADNKRVDFITIIAIFIVLFVEFKSLILPVLLIAVIKAAIFINMSIPYFAGGSMNYIGYLVVSTVMMGATIDYAILLTEHYMEERKKLPKLEAMKKTLGSVVKSALVSALILGVAGFSLGISSGEEIVKALGMLLGRGACIAFLLAITLLPAVLLLMDWCIPLFTYKADFAGCKNKKRQMKFGMQRKQI